MACYDWMIKYEIFKTLYLYDITYYIRVEIKYGIYDIYNL